MYGIVWAVDCLSFVDLVPCLRAHVAACGLSKLLSSLRGLTGQDLNLESSKGAQPVTSEEGLKSSLLGWRPSLLGSFCKGQDLK